MTKKSEQINNIEDLLNDIERIAKTNSMYYIKKNPKTFKIPKGPGLQDENIPRKPISTNPVEILAPLDEVFFDRELMDDLIVRTSIPQLLERKEPLYPGVILYGPPGTGKSEFQRAACKVYENAGAYAKQVSISSIHSAYVGEFARNLGRELQTAQEQGKIRGLPSLLCFDEGSLLAEQAKQGATSVSKHYQEAIDEIKRYVGNETGSHLVLAISTNLLPEDFEEAMTREGRLTTFLIDYPSKEQIARMWTHFLNKYEIISLTDEQSNELASLTPKVMGAFIAKFSEGYLSQRRHVLLQAKGYNSLLDALKKGENVSEKELKNSIQYDVLRGELKDYLNDAEKRNGQLDDDKTDIGFLSSLRRD